MTLWRFGKKDQTEANEPAIILHIRSAGKLVLRQSQNTTILVGP